MSKEAKQMKQVKAMSLGSSAILSIFALAMCITPAARADLALGDAANYGLIFSGGGHNTLQVTNVTINGNVGIANTGLMTDSGPSTINGAINFYAANTGQFSNNNSADVITGGIHYGVTADPLSVNHAFNTVAALNATLGMEAGNNLAINGNTTVNVSAGKSDGNGNRIFNVTSYNVTNGQMLTIIGNGVDNVVFNFAFSANLGGDVALSPGLGGDSVLFNFVGGSSSTLSGGPTASLNNNASSYPDLFFQGIILDPNGPISLTNANLKGRVFGGDSHDFQYVSGTTIDTPPPVVPEPSAVLLYGLGLMILPVMVRRRLALQRRP